MWFYAIDGTPQGPVTVEQLVATLHGFPDPAATHVWRDGMPAWQPAGTVPDVASRLAPPAPRLPPPPPMPSAAVEQDGEGPGAVAVAVASHYRRLVLLVGVLMLMGGALQASTLAGPSAVATALALVVLLAAFGVSIAMAITVYRLMSLLEDGVPALWAIATLVPVVSLLILLVISQKTQAWCRRHDIYVGLLGPAKASIEWLRRG
jgi:GYF domain 2